MTAAHPSVGPGVTRGVWALVGLVPQAVLLRVDSKPLPCSCQRSGHHSFLPWVDARREVPWLANQSDLCCSSM